MKTPKYILPLYRTIFAVLILAGLSAAGYAQVDRDELQNLPQVIFISYEGPHARLDTREQIRQIGVGLGRQISASENSLAPTLAEMSVERRRTYSYRFDAGGLNRYFVIHSVSAGEEGKINADVFGLGVDTGVDHIRNLRVIIQGYLQTTYNYVERDAAVLAEYITIYNAVYRGNWDYFLNRYKTPVIENITREKAGLSIRYDEWPGRTLILIPLGYGGLSAIDTSTISDSRVVEELRKEDDRGVQQRQDMVNLKEREAEQAEQRARTERETAREDERKNEQEKQEIAQEREKAQDDPQKQEELDKREQAAEEKDKEIEQRREDAQKLDDFAEKKTEEAQQERESIAKDQQAAINNETPDGLLGIRLERSEIGMGRLVRLNSSKNEIKRSPMDTVYIRTVTFTGGKIIAIAGENKGNGAVRLVDINQTNLEMAKQGDDDLLPTSLLWVNGSDIYAITIDLASGSCYLGRFDTDLVLRAKSSVKVNKSASVAIQQSRLITQREDGGVLLLNPADLTED